MIQYIVITLLFLFLILFVYIKIRHPFWNIQPVFHVYDYWRYTYTTPFLVYPFRPIKTKFYTPHSIQTLLYEDCSPKQQKDILNLLQCYSLNSEQILHTIDEQTLTTYLTGGNYSAMVSLQYGEYPLDTPPLLATMVSRSVRLLFSFPSLMSFPMVYPAYAMEFQTVQRDQPATKMNRTLLQTHEFNQRILQPDVAVSIIQKEIDLFDGVVPLTQYNTTTYVLQNRRFPALPPHFHVTQIDATTIHLLIDFLPTVPSAHFPVAILADPGQFAVLIKAQILWVSCLRFREDIYAFYFWKDVKTQYILPDDVAGDTLRSIATVQLFDQKGPHDRLFYLGFLHALQQIIKQKPGYKVLLIDDMADTVYMHSYWRAKHVPLFQHVSAYYLYNLIYPGSPVKPENCLMIL